jgi:hypothetical protein
MEAIRGMDNIKFLFGVPLQLRCDVCINKTSGVPRNFVRRGVQQIQLRTENRENGDLEAVAPYAGVLKTAVIWYKKFHFV